MSEHTKFPRLNRRKFAAVIAGTGAAAPVVLAQQTTPPAGAPNPNTAVQQQQQRRAVAPVEVMPFDGALEFSRKDVPAKAQPFPMTQVRLLPGSMFHDAQEWNRGYMSRLPVDRLAYNFRANAGLPVGSAQPFGGWEQKDDGQRGSELRGHFTGHFLSASANLWASTGDKEAKAKADELVAELAKCQEKLGGGYLSAFPMSLFERLDRLSGRPPAPRPADATATPATATAAAPAPAPPRAQLPVSETLPWAPFYTIHKIMAGLFDMYNLAGNQQALKVLEGMAGWADDWTGSKTEAHIRKS
jgi:uncharacterized protein